MQDLHSRMLAALLDGEGIRGVAELAAAEAGAPIAVVLPSRNLLAASDDSIDLKALGSANGDGPSVAAHREPVRAGDQIVGEVLALPAANGVARPSVDVAEILRTAALAVVTEVAVLDARDELAGELRGSLLEDLRARKVPSDEIVRRAARLGCDLTHGAVALVAEIHTVLPRHAVALLTSEHQGALAEVLSSGQDEQRVYALLPARGDAEAGERTLASARTLATRLRPHGPAAFSSFCENPEELSRAFAEAELMLAVVARDERLAEQLTGDVGDGVYRLLFRALASDPDEVRRFYEETVKPLVEHDRRYRTDLLGTLEAYLANDCNMNATARSVYAHRHTVAHRLQRIRELSGLDPANGADRERLGLGIKAYRILAPTLRR
jgi:sugar diacid utilization regulator